MNQPARPAGLFTVGHSNHEIEEFVGLLRQHAIDAVADVRSSPYSKYNPQFNREALQESLRRARVRYVFLGRELGARREESECYLDGKARYDLIAQSALFHTGLDRVRRGVESYRVALLCAEKDPITCHRTILVCRHLKNDVGQIQHVLEDGSLESQADAETRLLAVCKLPQQDLFHSRVELVEQAYEIQGERIAYVTATNVEELV